MKKNYVFIILLVLTMSNLTAQNVCQEQNFTNNGVGGNIIGQSIFMRVCSGFFSSIELERNDEGVELIAEFTIFTGQTFMGTPRYTQMVLIPQGEGPFTINFNDGVGDLSFFEDSQYTFMLSNPALQLKSSSDINSYEDGQMFIDVGFINNDDLWFKLSITSTLNIANSEIQKQSLFPNPASDYFRISGIDQSGIFTIYNRLGIVVKNGIVSKDEEVNIQNLPNGLYFLKIDDGKTFKFIKH